MRLWAGVAAVLLLAFLGWRLFHRRPKPPFELSFWYWHSPFVVTPQQSADLKRLGVRKLFVRAGTFSGDGKNAVLVIPQTYRGGKVDFKIHLVFNFDAGIVRHFESYSLDTIAPQIASRIDKQVKRAQGAGLDVVGVQFDFDCPTRLLSRYADLIAKVRPQIKSLPYPVVSATSLMSWLGTQGAMELSRQVDFLAPQAYEGVTGMTADTMRPVSDEADFRRRIGLADSLDCPFYVGIPAYGHAFLFNEDGKLANIYRQLEPSEVFRHPAFTFLDAYATDPSGRPAKTPQDSVGEEIVKFKAIHDGINGEGMGDTLGFSVPTPVVLQRMLKAARETQSPNCLGGIIYRMPQPDSEMCLPWNTMIAALSGRVIQPKLKIGFETFTDNFDVIESSKPLADAPKDLDLEVENTGGSSFLSPDAVELMVHLEYPGIDEVNPRDMKMVLVGRLDGDTIRESSTADADAVQLSRFHMSSGQKISVGPIRLMSSKRQHVTVEWKARSADGFGVQTGKFDLSQ